MERDETPSRKCSRRVQVTYLPRGQFGVLRGRDVDLLREEVRGQDTQDTNPGTVGKLPLSGGGNTEVGRASASGKAFWTTRASEAILNLELLIGQGAPYGTLEGGPWNCVCHLKVGSLDHPRASHAMRCRSLVVLFGRNFGDAASRD